MIRTLKMVLCAGVAALAAGLSASAQTGFTPAQEQTFTSECAAGGAEASLCACIWSGLQTRMSGAEFTAMDAAFRAQQTHPAMGAFELAVGECNGTSRITASNPEAYPGHTSANFMNGCVSGGVSQAICACSMNQIEREMPLQTFVELDRMMSWGKGEQHPQYQNFVRIVQQCAVNNQ